MRPSLRQLEYLVALADRLHFRAAAEASHVTQPALSAQIAQLEQDLGVQLFERDRRRVMPTAAGGAVVERARVILAQLDELVESTRTWRAPLAGRLRLGVIPTVGPYLLPKVLPDVRRKHPQLELLLREDRTPHLVEALAHGKLDLVLLALEADLGDARTLPLFRDEFVLLLPRGHRLAARKQVREADLADEQVLLLEDGHCLRDQALGLCQRAGAQELADLRASSMSTLVQMVASSFGVTLLPELAVPVEARGRELVTLPFTKPRPFRTIGLGWRPTSPRAAEFELLAQTLGRAVRT